MPRFSPTSNGHFSTTRTFSAETRRDDIAKAIWASGNSSPMGQVRNLG